MTLSSELLDTTVSQRYKASVYKFPHNFAKNDKCTPCIARNRWKEEANLPTLVHKKMHLQAFTWWCPLYILSIIAPRLGQIRSVTAALWARNTSQLRPRACQQPQPHRPQQRIPMFLWQQKKKMYFVVPSLPPPPRLNSWDFGIRSVGVRKRRAAYLRFRWDVV